MWQIFLTPFRQSCHVHDCLIFRCVYFKTNNHEDELCAGKPGVITMKRKIIYMDTALDHVALYILLVNGFSGGMSATVSIGV